MTDPHASSFDREAVKRKYAEERSKRMIEGRAATRDLSVDERFASYRDDPFTPLRRARPDRRRVDVVIIGAGIAGVLAGSELRAPASSGSGSSTAPAASAAPGTGTATRA